VGDAGGAWDRRLSAVASYDQSSDEKQKRTNGRSGGIELREMWPLSQ